MKPSRLAILLCMTTLTTSCATSHNKDEKPHTRAAKINAQLGIAYLQQQDFTRAKRKLQLALKQDNTIPETWYSMAYYLEKMGNTKKADSYYQKAITISHARGDAENNYGTFLCRKGKYEQAIKHFVLATHDAHYINPADAYENAGLCAKRMPNMAKATAFFNRALNADPERATSLMALAEINFKQGNLNVAQQDLNRFLKLSPPTEQSMALSAKLEKQSKLIA